MTVQQIMTTQIVTVDLDTKLAVVKEIFDKHKFHHLLVLEAGKLFGVISDRDLLKALSPNLGTMAETDKDAATLSKRVCWRAVKTDHPCALNSDQAFQQRSRPAAVDKSTRLGWS